MLADERLTNVDEVRSDDAAGSLGRLAKRWFDDGCAVTVLVHAPDADLAGTAAELPNSELASLVAGLHGAGRHDEVAAVLASTHWSRLGAFGLTDLRVLLAAMGDEIAAAHPGAWLHAALHALQEQHGGELRDEWLTRVDKAAAADDELRPMIEAERARDLVRDIRVDDARLLAERVLRGDRAGDRAARGRALQVLAKIEMWDGTPEALLRAESLLREAISAYQLAGEHVWEANAWLELGFGVHQLNGAFDHAIEAIGSAVRLLGAATSQRTFTLTFYAEVLTELGRYDEALAALHEAESIAHARNDHMGAAYAAWSLARLHSRRRDREATVAYLQQVRMNRTDWYAHPAGAAFHGEAAEMFTHLGDEAAARAELTRAEQLAVDHHSITDVPRAMIEARFGDPHRAGELLAELIEAPTTWQRNRWRYMLYAAWAAHRAGDEQQAEEQARAAALAAQAMGHPELLAIGEPELHAHFFGAPAAGEAELSVRLLGEFEVRRGGVLVELPPGGPCRLVQHLALFGPSSAESIADRMWPDADVETAKRRLRNLLGRVRQHGGRLIERAGPMVRLVEGVHVDVHEFMADAAVALSAPDAERAGLARLAIARGTADLLPDDRYDDDVAVERERLRRRMVDLLDLVAADAADRGDLLEAVRLSEQAIALEPYDGERYEMLAGWLMQLGRRGSARDVVARGLATAGDLGVAPTPTLAALADRLASAL